MTQVVLTEIHGKVGLIRINRPEALNALNDDVVDGIGTAILQLVSADFVQQANAAPFLRHVKHATVPGFLDRLQR